MPVDLVEGPPGTHRRRRTPGAGHTAPPLERAQVVWRRAIELGGTLVGHDPPEAALDLLRVALHDVSTMAHALALGRTRLRGDTDNTEVAGGVDVLQRAVRFLGARPDRCDAAVGR